jgi:hypothetical protein
LHEANVIASTQYQSSVTATKVVTPTVVVGYNELTSLYKFNEKFRRKRIYFRAFNSKSLNTKGKIVPVLNYLRKAAP